MKTKAIFVLIVVTSFEQALAAPSFNCNNTATQCLPSGSVVTCTCTVEDALGTQFTQWEGTAVSQCPITPNEIVFIHPSFTARPPVQCGDRLVAAPVSQDFRNYTSDVSITVDTTNNGSNIGCSLAGTSPPVGVTTLRVGEIPPSVGTPSIPPSSLTRIMFSLLWIEPMNVFGGVGGYEVMVRSDQAGDIIRLCGRMGTPNGEAAPLRKFTDWITEGQICYFSMVAVTGDNCNFRSNPSQEVAITLQGPNQTAVENISLSNPVYIDNHLKRIKISFMYTQESPLLIIDGVTSVTTSFSITYSYSTSGSCTMIVPISCDQQQWCNYILTLDNCPVQTLGNGTFIIVPLNVIGSGNSRVSDKIANRNPLFSLSDENDINSRRKSLQLNFLETFISATCFVYYGLGGDCSNLNLSRTIIQMNSDTVFINFTLINSGMYCYRITCTVTPNSIPSASIISAQGNMEYQSIITVTVADSKNGVDFPLWSIAIIIIVILPILMAIIISVVLVWKRRSHETPISQGHHAGQSSKEECEMPVYEDVTQPKVCNETFEMGENVAYGPVLKCRSN